VAEYRLSNRVPGGGSTVLQFGGAYDVAGFGAGADRLSLLFSLRFEKPV